jgi:NAD(P)-dependent dehydrogenase (short-subunit alcohol dehydrogenase family)
MTRVTLTDGLALITGAGSGIGEATALRLAREGTRVLCADIDDEAAGRVAEACTAAGPPAAALHCDVADASAMMALADSVEREHGPLDILVNNAGVGVLGDFLGSTVADWEWLRSINLDGVAHGCYAFGPAMTERGRGHVVNVASGAAYVPNRQMAAYCASKAAVVSLSQCLRADWARHGVGVSVVCPGVISTPIATNSRYRGGADGKQSRADRTLRMGHSPDLVAKAIVSCVQRNRDVVPVGLESTLAYKLLRGAPQPLLGLVARATAL